MRSFRASLLIATFLISNVAKAQEIVPGLAQKFSDLVSAGKEGSLERASGVLVLWVKTLTPEKFDYDVMKTSEVIDVLKGCKFKHISDKYGEIIWTCPDRILPDRKCYNDSYVGTVKMFSAGIVTRLQKSDDWSEDRCGKAPIFLPPPVLKSGSGAPN